MKITALDESIIQDIGHAFGYYDYGSESGLITAFPSRDAAASFICGYVRMALQSEILYTAYNFHPTACSRPLIKRR